MACGAAIENAHGFTNAEGGIWRSNRKCAHEFTNAEGESGLRACVYAGAPFVDLACTPTGWNLRRPSETFRVSCGCSWREGGKGVCKIGGTVLS